MTDEMTDPRKLARTEILQAANQYRFNRYRNTRLRIPLRLPALFGMRQLQQAVAVVRQHKLVPPDTLTAAGFRPERKTR